MFAPSILTPVLLVLGASTTFAQSDPVLLAKVVDSGAAAKSVLARDMDFSDGALLAGAPNANNGPGFATLFQLDATGRATKVQSLTWSGSQTNDYFGWSTAIDLQGAAVGVRNANDVGALSAGKVQMFNRIASPQGATRLVPTQILRSAQPTGQGHFGDSLDLEGTLLAVGEPGGAGVVAQTGTVQLFDVSSTPYQPIDVLVAPNGQGGDELGAEVLIAGTTLLAAAMSEDVAGTADAGAVHLFQRDAQGNWNHAGRLISPTPSVGAEFGRGLETDGTTLYIGAPYELAGGLSSGAVHLYQLQVGGWSLTQTLLPDQGISNHLFGTSIEVVGDRMFVGASGSAAVSARGGEIQVFDRIGGLWQHSFSFQVQDLGYGDRFGLDIVVDGGRLVTSAKGGDEPYPSSGNAYVYAVDGTAPSPMTPLRQFVKAGTTNTHFILVRPGAAFAGDLYFVLGSADPSPVPTLVNGVLLPFMLDTYSVLTFTNANQGAFRDTLGLLDQNGEAEARITLLPHETASLVGVTLRHTTILIDDVSLGVTGVLGPTEMTFVP